MRLLFALVLMAAVMVLSFPPSLMADIKGDVSAGKSYATAIENARSSGESEYNIVGNLILAGVPPADAVSAALKAGFSPSAVIPSAIITGMSDNIPRTTFDTDTAALDANIDVETVTCLTTDAKGNLDELTEAALQAGYALDIVTEFLCGCCADAPICDLPLAPSSDTRDLPYMSPSE